MTRHFVDTMVSGKNVYLHPLSTHHGGEQDGTGYKYTYVPVPNDLQINCGTSENVGLLWGPLTSHIVAIKISPLGMNYLLSPVAAVIGTSLKCSL